MAVCAGTCLYTPDNGTTESECKILEKLLSGCGVCEKVSEKLMDTGDSLPGCGPAFVSKYFNFNGNL